MLPLSLGVRHSNRNPSTRYDRTFSSGASIHLYPHGQSDLHPFYNSLAKYFIGGSLEYGFFKYDHFENANIKVSEPEPIYGSYLFILVDNGVAIQNSKIKLRLIFSVGTKKVLTFNTYNYNIDNILLPRDGRSLGVVRIGFNLGFKF